MPRAIPCLGYPSRSAAALALQSKGLVIDEVARQIGVDAKCASALIASAANRNKWAGTRRTVVFDVATLERLKAHAERRGCSPNEMARQIIEAAIDGDLINAILDDQVA